MIKIDKVISSSLVPVGLCENRSKLIETMIIIVYRILAGFGHRDRWMQIVQRL